MTKDDWRASHPEVRWFDSLEAAMRANYTIILGDGYYGRGGMELPRSAYAELFKAINGP